MKLKASLSMGNHCYFASQPIFQSKNVSGTSTVSIIYKIILRPVVLFYLFFLVV